MMRVMVLGGWEVAGLVEGVYTKAYCDSLIVIHFAQKAG